MMALDADPSRCSAAAICLLLSNYIVAPELRQHPAVSVTISWGQTQSGNTTTFRTGRNVQEQQIYPPQVYRGGEQLVDYDLYTDVVATAKVGDSIVHTAAALGIGHVVYRITRIDASEVYGVEQRTRRGCSISRKSGKQPARASHDMNQNDKDETRMTTMTTMTTTTTETKEASAKRIRIALFVTGLNIAVAFFVLYFRREINADRILAIGLIILFLTFVRIWTNALRQPTTTRRKNDEMIDETILNRAFTTATPAAGYLGR